MTPGSPLQAEDLLKPKDSYRWDRFVRKFRRDHNFAYTLGFSSGEWKIDRIGKYEDKTISQKGVMSLAQYTFHLPIVSGFGYFLGSTMGYHAVDERLTEGFRPVGSWMLPGITLGLSQNATSYLRGQLVFDYHLERFNALTVRVPNEKDTTIHVTMYSRSAGLQADLFYDLSWALRAEYHMRVLHYEKPKIKEDSPEFPVDSKFNLYDIWYGISVVYHVI